MNAWVVYSKDGLTSKCEVRSLEYNGEFLGACSLSVTIESPTPIQFAIGDYLVYRGERFEINYDPSVIKSSSVGASGDAFSYENIVFNSLSDELTRCDFLDFVPSDNNIHYSSLPNFSFFAESIHALAERIQVNLDRVYQGEKKWTVEVHPEYINKSNINISVNSVTCWDALALVKSQFNANFIIRNRTIIIGTAGLPIETVFSYGKGNGLITIERNAEGNQKIITRLRAYGSTRNMPMRYYANLKEGLPNNLAVNNLMLPSFPNDTLDPYIDSKNVKEIGVREGTVFFDGSGDLEEIYPSMEGVTADDLKNAGISVSSEGRLDEVLEAEQISDNGIFEEGDDIASFTITLKDIGFDLNDYLSTQSATISMKDGMCGGREFEIILCKKEGDNYLITCNRSYDSGLDLYFPYNDYQIKSGDKFVLLNIEMPDVYVKAASQRLLKAAEEYLSKNDYVRYSYSPKVDSLFMARQHEESIKLGLKSIHDSIKEGGLMLFEDKDLGIEGSVIIDSLRINENTEDGYIPTYEITLRNDKTVGTLDKIQNQIDSIVSGKPNTNEGGGSYNSEQIKSLILAHGSKHFIRKDKNDSTPYNLGIGGNLILKDKPIAELTRFYDEEKPEHATDVAIYSALMTEKAIEASLGDLGDKYLRKDKEDTAHKRITFEEGITVYDLAKMLNLEVSELATIARAVIKAGEGMNEYITSDRFVEGFFGEGFRIWHDLAAGNWNLTLDNLTVRKVMMIYELVIQKIRAVGGMLVVSAGNGKIKEVTRVGLEYKFTFEDTNTFAENDLIRCQVFSQNRLKYYWVEVTRVEGEDVYTRVADYNGVVPEEGDECVLMGNTKNIKRQNLILVSATEDGQPRFDCYDGIKSKNFEGCLRTRVGNLDGIHDDRFPAALQPKGYGLYADNCFLTGVFVLSTGVEVGTQFSIMEGMIRSEISSVRAEINAKDNYLANASFASNLDLWEYENDVHVFDTAGGLLHFNGQFYSDKRIFAGVVAKDSKNVLRIKNSSICQKNDDFNLKPTFDLYKNEETGEEKYRPRMFYVSFRYMVASAGTLRIYFRGETNDGTWEEYTSLDITEQFSQTTNFASFERPSKWNGTGDFYISFDGDIFIYDLALTDNALEDMAEKFNSRFELTDKKIEANFNHTAGKLEEYHSEFKLTAEELELSFNKSLTDQYSKITTEYTGKITQTAESLTSDYTLKIKDANDKVVEDYTSKITQTAKEIRADLTSYVDDVESGLVSDYESQISLTARNLRSEFSEEIEDRITGVTNSYQSAISQSAREIRADLYSVEEDLDGRISTNSSNISAQAAQISTLVSTVTSFGSTISSHTTAINQNANNIALKASQSSVDTLTNRVATAESNITTAAGNISALSKKLTFDSSGNLTNISKSGLVLDSEFASLFTTQVNSQGIAKTASLTSYVAKTELGDLVSKITISADQINLTGKVEFSDLTSTAQSTINGKANKDLSNASVGGVTVISGGKINADLIDVNTIVAKKVVTNSDTNGVDVTIQDGYLNMKKGTTTLVSISSEGGTSGGIGLYTTTAAGSTMSLSPNGFYHYSTSGSVQLKDGVLKFMDKAKLNNLRLVTMGSGNGDGNFFVANGSFSLPSVSIESGKIIWVYAKSNTSVSGFYDANGSYVSSSQTMKGMNFFISDGSYWYRGYCQ